MKNLNIEKIYKRKCKHCGESFKSERKHAIVCASCKAKNRNHPEILCKFCGKSFRLVSKKQTFCSTECSSVYFRNKPEFEDKKRIDELRELLGINTQSDTERVKIVKYLRKNKNLTEISELTGITVGTMQSWIHWLDRGKILGYEPNKKHIELIRKYTEILK